MTNLIPNPNTAPLAWWRNLDIESQKQVHQESKHSHFTFQMFCMSTLAIRTAWNERNERNDLK